MPKSIIVDILAVAVGGITGTALKRVLPQQLKDELPIGLGLCSFAIGINSLLRIHSITKVIMAVLFGFVLGSLLRIEHHATQGFTCLFSRLNRKVADLTMFVTAFTLFCCSATGWYGAMLEGINNDSGLLLSKSFLDFFPP